MSKINAYSYLQTKNYSNIENFRGVNMEVLTPFPNLIEVNLLSDINLVSLKRLTKILYDEMKFNYSFLLVKLYEKSILDEKEKLDYFEYITNLNFNNIKIYLGNNISINLKNQLYSNSKKHIINEQFRNVFLPKNYMITFKNDTTENLKVPSFLDIKAYNKDSERNFLKSFKNKKASIIKDFKTLPQTEYTIKNMINQKISVKGRIFLVEENYRKSKDIYFTYVYLTDEYESVVCEFISKSQIKINENDILDIEGVYVFDEFKQIPLIKNSEIINITKNEVKEEQAKSTRIELNLKSNYSNLDGILSLEQWFANLKRLGINTVCFQDYDSIQNFPDVEILSKKNEIRPVYGVTLNMIDDNMYKIYYENNENLNEEVFVAFDIETTGFSVKYDEIIQISAIKFTKEKIISKFDHFIKLKDNKKLSEDIINLTNIDLNLLEIEGKDEEIVLSEFRDFIKNTTLVGHNVLFDYDFLRFKIKEVLNEEISNNLIDTLNFSRAIFEMKSYSLDKVAQKLQISEFNHHRADADTYATYQIFIKLIDLLNSGQNYSLEELRENTKYIAKIKLASKKVLEYAIKNINYDNLVDESENSKTKATLILKCDKNTLIENYNNLLSVGKSTKILEIKEDIKTEFKITKLNNLIKEENIINSSKQMEITIICKNNEGKKELYKLISKSLTTRLNKKCKNVILKSDLESQVRKNLLIGTSNVLGYFKNVYEKWNLSLDISFFDYVEISPLKTYLSVTNNPYQKLEHIKETIRYISILAIKKNILPIFTSNGYYFSDNDLDTREIYTNVEFAGSFHPLRNAKEIGENMCYLTDKLHVLLKNDYDFKDTFIEKLLFTNPNELINKIENIEIIPKELYTPRDDFFKDRSKNIVGREILSVKEEFLKIVNEALEKYKYNNVLHPYVKERVDKELKSLIDNGYYIIYYISYLLVKKSNDDGYVVGSRGSVGSSFIAYLMGITEVNPLKPHYICPNCHKQHYKGESEFGSLEDVLDGFDLKEEVCPKCGAKMLRDGHDIPFETFLGFDGDKVPDIDLNFSGDYQGIAHDFCKEVFGIDKSFRAGTIMTVAEKTAEMYVKKYSERKHIYNSYAEIKRKAIKMTGTKRSTGQHPAGIVVCPEYKDIYDFTPIQYPANKKGEWFTTHFDYHKLDANLLKLDILGHDDPTMLKMLMENVAKNPEKYPFNNVKDIPVCDKLIFDLLREDNNGLIDALGISEFGTNFVMGMLKDINIETFADLVKVSGLSHGTNVWLNNSYELVKGNTSYGKIPFKDVIGCRDDIMVTLLNYGLEPKIAFKIMEFVRKGKPKKEKDKWDELKQYMINRRVPDWYIWSLEQIEYMFPKAHAVAYVMSALRIAWFKAYMPLDFYQTIFSVRAETIESEIISTNDEAFILNKINTMKSEKNLSKTDEDTIHFLELALEMIKKGFKFKMPDINLSDAKKFVQLDDKTLLMPFSVLKGVGEKTALKVVENRKDGYKDFEDFKKNSGADKNLVQILENYC